MDEDSIIKITSPLESKGSVSYTHLDVYKRQRREFLVGEKESWIVIEYILE